MAISWPQLATAQSITATTDSFNPCCIQITTTLPGLTVWILDRDDNFLDELFVPTVGGAPYCFDANGQYQVVAYQFLQTPGTPSPDPVEVEIIGCPYEIFTSPDPEDPCCISVSTNLPGLLNVDITDENGDEVTSITITDEETEFCFEENGTYTITPTTCVCPDINDENWPSPVSVSITECENCDNDNLDFGCFEKIIGVSLEGCELCFSLYTAPGCNSYQLFVNGVMTEYPHGSVPGGYEQHCYQFPGAGDYEVYFLETDCNGNITDECPEGDPLNICIEDCDPDPCANVDPVWELVCFDTWFCIIDEFGGSHVMEWIEPPFLDDPTGQCHGYEDLQNGDPLIFNISTWVDGIECVTTINTVLECRPGFGAPRENINDSGSNAKRSDIKVTISPNPAKDFLNITSLDVTNTIVQIIDVEGRLIITEQLEGNNNSIHTSSLSAGLYFVKVLDAATNEKLHLEKIMIIK